MINFSMLNSATLEDVAEVTGFPVADLCYVKGFAGIVFRRGTDGGVVMVACTQRGWKRAARMGYRPYQAK